MVANGREDVLENNTLCSLRGGAEMQGGIFARRFGGSGRNECDIVSSPGLALA